MKIVDIKVPLKAGEGEIKGILRKKTRLNKFSWKIVKKSLDARKKDNICWQIRAAVFSNTLPAGTELEAESFQIPYRRRNKKIVVAGSGPAGFFSAYALQKAGFDTLILERGTELDKRSASITAFEEGGQFPENSNYAFGEGGAGTFSDGKLTSRSKHISKERQFIHQTYLDAGAPEEISYLSHPHLGSDNLKKMVKRMRKSYISCGGSIRFESCLDNFVIKNGTIKAVVCGEEEIKADYFILATGHSSFDTYRMLIQNGVGFLPKNFALGCRVEHPQELINKAQWGHSSLPGVKAAEYRLTAKTETGRPVYTFCMCPGGIVVPAAAYGNTNLVNGMSLYQRNGVYANAACVAGINPVDQFGQETNALFVLNWLENLEKEFYSSVNGYKAPACTIESFLRGKEPQPARDTSYPLGTELRALHRLLPEDIVSALQEGLTQFSRKIEGFETGNIIGLESKTSSPVQVIREKNGLCKGFTNLFCVGEGSGYSGGIISSGADGLRTAFALID